MPLTGPCRTPAPPQSGELGIRDDYGAQQRAVPQQAAGLWGFEHFADPDPPLAGEIRQRQNHLRDNSPTGHGNRIGRDTANIDKRGIWLSEQITGDYLGPPTAIGHSSSPLESSFPLVPCPGARVQAQQLTYIQCYLNDKIQLIRD